MQRPALIFACLLWGIVAPGIPAAWAIDRGAEVPDEQAETDPQASLEHNRDGLVAIAAGEYGEALQEFTKAIKFNPENAMARNNRAFLRATCPEARYRDAAKAVADATKACELQRWKDSYSLDTLAAAYAEKGDFDEAQKWQLKAIEISRDDSVQRGMRQRHELYKSGKPYREGPLKDGN